MSTVDTTPASTLTPRQVKTVFVGLMVSLLLSSLDTTIVATALPTIAGNLGGLEHIAWVATAYLLTSTAATPLFGKLSDLYGRKALFRAAIVIFLVGSLLAGASQSFFQLVMARGVQGIGAGGLMAMSFVIIGDIVPPRQRGRYVGFLTSVFAFGSVTGPLIGGFFVDNLTWRWIFTVNIPIGIVAWFVTSVALRIPFNRRPHKIDYPGAALLVAGVTSIILMTTWGGKEYPWGSPRIIALGILGAVLVVAFCLWEQRAEEPILPMRLFRNRVFTISVAMGFFIGSALYSSDSFLPLFLQAVTGASATKAGLLLTPLMAGVTVSAILSGRLTARTGRYKHWPILGGTLAVTGMVLLAQIHAGISRGYISLAMVILGAGLGMTMPTMTLAVQNSVDWKDLGVATSAVTFIRSLGGAVGLAAYGAVFGGRINRLAPELRRLVESPASIKALPEPTHGLVIHALAHAIQGVFVVAAPVMLIAWVISFFVPELPLRDTSALDRSKSDLGTAPALH